MERLAFLSVPGGYSRDLRYKVTMSICDLYFDIFCSKVNLSEGVFSDASMVPLDSQLFLELMFLGVLNC